MISTFGGFYRYALRLCEQLMKLPGIYFMASFLYVRVILYYLTTGIDDNHY